LTAAAISAAVKSLAAHTNDADVACTSQSDVDDDEDKRRLTSPLKTFSDAATMAAFNCLLFVMDGSVGATFVLTVENSIRNGGGNSLGSSLGSSLGFAVGFLMYSRLGISLGIPLGSIVVTIGSDMTGEFRFGGALGPVVTIGSEI